MNERITIIRKSEGLNQEKFASKLNLSRNFINQLEAGKKNPSERTILDICETFNVNEIWLRTGEGEMYVQRSKEEELINFTADLLLEETDSFKKRLLSALAKLSDEEWDLVENLVNKLAEDTKKE